MVHIRPDRVAIYVRWSTDDQGEGTTPAVQLEGCRHYVLSQGWHPRDDLTFIDDGYSGGNLDRPGLTRLRELVARGEVDCVVVFKVDRLSRNIVDAVDLVLREWQGRCAFKSAREPIDTTTDLGRVIFGILAMFADFERSQIRERTLSGKLRRIAAGEQLHGEPAYGYRRSPVRGQWEEEPAEAELVRRIFRLAAAGESAAAICRRLNTEGCRTRAGKLWTSRAVLWILRNRLYIGEVVFGRTQLRRTEERPGRTLRVRRSGPVICAPTRAAPALVDRELFLTVQQILEERRARHRAVGGRGLGSPHLLVGLARCPCGGALAAKRQRNRVRYYCPGAGQGRCGRHPGYIPREAVEPPVLVLLAALAGPGVLEGGRAEAALAQWEQGLRALEAQRAEAERALRRLAEQEDRLLRKVREGAVDPRDLPDLRRSHEEERSRTLQRLEALAGQIAALQARLERGRQIAREPLALPRLLERVPVPRLRELLRTALAEPAILHKAKGDRTVRIALTWYSRNKKEFPEKARTHPSTD
ncbi:MAG TPA: recombinase family protein [Symbiobacteriaceae bacterium]